MKNIKIGDDAHKKMSLLAAEMSVKKGDLSTALILASINLLHQKKIEEYLDIVTSDVNYKAESEH
ncbi:hypothetical protein [Janthinobacterium sp. MDB2-8]|uniref:hypothetical protein n=1 Tax=Janthinobacterium sp. MDB2-8 TaxID=1259338 RepID=UPI003F26A124